MVGFDDHDLAAAMGLTTIRQRVRELGAIAAQRMLTISVERPDAVHELMPVELVVRDTTAGPH